MVTSTCSLDGVADTAIRSRDTGPSGRGLAPHQALEHQPRPRISANKSARARLIRLARAHPDWALGFEEETWGSRVARPSLHRWATPAQPLRLVEQTVAPHDPDPVALACYGLVVRLGTDAAVREEARLRFTDGHPVSALTTQFLAWCCAHLAARGKRALLLVWDNAPWSVSKAVRTWMRAHNQQVKQAGPGVRIIACYLPIKSPWLNPLEPRWIHCKRKIVEPARLLTAHEVEERVCGALRCPRSAHLVVPEKVA